MRRGRTRHQSGWITDGARAGSYQLHWTEYVLGEDGKERRIHRSETIECKRKYQAQERLDEIVGKLNPIGATKKDGTILVKNFVETRWKPLKSGKWRESTGVTSNYLIGLILDRWGDTPLNELDKVGLQIWLNDCAKKYARDVVKHLRTFLISICSEAVDQDYIAKDPTRNLDMPITKQGDQTVLEWEQYRSVLALLEKERDRLIVKVAAACAVRPEELFGLRWNSMRQTVICDNNGEQISTWVLSIRDTVYQYKLREMTKTEGSRDDVGIPAGLDAELLDYRTRSKFNKDTDFIFTSRDGNFVSAGDFLNRILAPIRVKLGLAKLNFRILRRTYATHARKFGSDTSVARQLRHVNTATTKKHYIKPIDYEVYKMNNAVYEEMMGEAKGRVQ